MSGFPTIKFKPAGSKEWIAYEGDRSYESLVEFLEANAVNDIDTPDEVDVEAADVEGQTVVKSPDHHDEL